MEEIKQNLKNKESELIEENPWFITKKTFKRFIYKYALPFQYETNEIDKFFENNPDVIKLPQFEKLVE